MLYSVRFTIGTTIYYFGKDPSIHTLTRNLLGMGFTQVEMPNNYQGYGVFVNSDFESIKFEIVMVGTRTPVSRGISLSEFVRSRLFEQQNPQKRKVYVFA